MTISVEKTFDTNEKEETEDTMPSLYNNTYEKEVPQLTTLNLTKCQKIGFYLDEQEVKNANLLSHGGVEVTYIVYDVSSLPGLKKWEKKRNDLPVIALVCMKCKSRVKGDMQLTVKSPDGEVVATFGRNKSRGLFEKDADTEIPICLLPDKSKKYILKPDMVARKRTEIFLCNKEGNYSNVSYKMWCPAWQSRTKWCLFSFLCFFPTFGISACIGFCCMLNSKVVHKIDKYENGEKVKELVDSTHSVIDFEGVSDLEDKFALFILRAFIEADSIASPPSNNNAGSSM